MLNKFTSYWTIAVLIPLLISACGGGGGGAAVSPASTVSATPWTKQMGVASVDTDAYGIALDSTNGYVYIAGYTKGGLDGNTLSGLSDYFLTRYNSSGAHTTKQDGVSNAYTGVQGVTVDSSGNAYIAGNSTGNLDNITLAGNDGYVLVKYNSSGVKQYAKLVGPAGTTYANAVVVDIVGDVFVAGSTTTGLNGNTLTGSSDFFLVKYDSQGNWQYTKQLGTSGKGTVANAVAVDSYGNVFIAGWTTGGLDGNTLTGTYDFFLTAYDSLGNKLFTKQMGTAGAITAANGVTVDSGDNVYVTGTTGGNLDGITAAAGNNAFLVKYTFSTSNYTATKKFTKLLGAGGTNSFAVAIDGSGSVYVAGGTFDSLDNKTTVTGQYDYYFAKYDTLGNMQYSAMGQGAATSSNTVAQAVAVDSSGYVYLAGHTDAGPSGNQLTGTMDLFVAKYDSSGKLQ